MGGICLRMFVLVGSHYCCCKDLSQGRQKAGGVIILEEGGVGVLKGGEWRGRDLGKGKKGVGRQEMNGFS